MILDNKISMGHARVLSKLDDDDKIREYADKVVSNNMSVRDLEDLSSGTEVKKRVPVVRREKVNNYGYVEEELREILGTKVKVNNKRMEIYFDSNKDLDRILEIMNIKIN
jgi:ParB family chromosome partitioning protein